jgi:hypothetical protein
MQVSFANFFGLCFVFFGLEFRLGVTLFHIRGGLESKRQNIFTSTLSPRYQNLEHHGMLHDPLEMKQS